MHVLKTMLLALAFAGGPAHAAPNHSTPTAAPRTALILGDSLSSAHRMPQEAGWVALLQQRLATETTPTTIVNISRGGKTLVDGMGELPALLAEHHPDVVVIELGGNDAILGMTEEDLQKHLGGLVDLARGNGAEVAILGFAIPPAFDKNGSAAILQSVYAKAARDRGVTLLPSLLEGISGNPALLQDDGIHPNAAAQPRVLDNAWKTLRPLLQP